MAGSGMPGRGRVPLRRFLQAYGQSAVLGAQCVQQLPATPTDGDVVPQALRFLHLEFPVNENGDGLFRITFHGQLLPWPSLRRSSCFARNIKAATLSRLSPNCPAISS